MFAYLAAVWNIRYFWFNLVRMDIRSRYRGSILGLGWSMLHPIAMTVILTLVFSTLFGAETKDYAPYVMSGMTCWAFLSTVVGGGCVCFFQAEAYIRQVPAPLAIYPLRCVLSGGFHFAIALLMVIGLQAVLNGPPPLLPLLSLIPSMLLFMIFGWSLAAVFGLLNVRFRDTHHLTDVGLQALYFLTPIIYRPDLLIQKGLGLVIRLNPVVPFIELIRAPILRGSVPALTDYLLAALTATVFATAAAFILRRQERGLIFHL
jgi:ABC-type polysaccharide/polyol phosphate export permease